MFFHNKKAISLLELVVSLVVIITMLVFTVSAMDVVTRSGIDPIVNLKAYAFLEAYMDEISQKAYSDPETSLVCDVNGETNRINFDDVCDYDGLSESPHSASDTVISGLENFVIEVDVDNNTTFEGISGAANVLKITVTGRQDGEVVASLVKYITS